jgi:hypothetical protein
MFSESITLGLVVEGQGDEQAAPILIRRVALTLGFHAAINCKRWRVRKAEFVQPGEVERSIEALTRQIGRMNPILVLLDADDQCPMNLAADLIARCRVGHPDVAISIVIAKKEYEAWFLAAAQSLAGKRGLAKELEPPADPESVQGAKEWLTARMPPDQSYSPTRHQAAYSELMDLSEARNARSFRKFEKEVGRLLGWTSV